MGGVGGAPARGGGAGRGPSGQGQGPSPPQPPQVRDGCRGGPPTAPGAPAAPHSHPGPGLLMGGVINPEKSDGGAAGTPPPPPGPPPRLGVRAARSPRPGHARGAQPRNAAG